MIGMLTRYNKKTVTVIIDTGEHWDISPYFLQRAEESPSNEVRDPNVIPMHKKWRGRVFPAILVAHAERPLRLGARREPALSPCVATAFRS